MHLHLKSVVNIQSVTGFVILKHLAFMYVYKLRCDNAFSERYEQKTLAIIFQMFIL